MTKLKYFRNGTRKNDHKDYLTCADGVGVPKRDRAEYCNLIGADILVSLHHNSYQKDSDVYHSTDLCYKNSDQLLASSILNSNSNTINVQNQGIIKFDNSLLWVAKNASNT